MYSPTCIASRASRSVYPAIADLACTRDVTPSRGRSIPPKSLETIRRQRGHHKLQPCSDKRSLHVDRRCRIIFNLAASKSSRLRGSCIDSRAANGFSRFCLKADVDLIAAQRAIDSVKASFVGSLILSSSAPIVVNRVDSFSNSSAHSLVTRGNILSKICIPVAAGPSTSNIGPCSRLTSTTRFFPLLGCTRSHR